MKNVMTACQMEALSFQIWLLAPMMVIIILNANSIIRRTEVRRTKGTLKKVLSPEWRGSSTFRMEGSGRSGTPMLTWVWALSPPLPPICPEVPCKADQCLHLLHPWKLLLLMFCFVSGSPDFGAISFQLFWISPLPASCSYWLPLLLFLFPLCLGQSHFQCWISPHSKQDLSCCFGYPDCCTSAMISALVIISVVALLAPNLDGAAFFACIHSPLFNRLR